MKDEILLGLVLVCVCVLAVVLLQPKPKPDIAPIVPSISVAPDRPSLPTEYVKPCSIMSSLTDKWVVIDARLKVVAKAATRSEAQRIADELNAQ